MKTRFLFIGMGMVISMLAISVILFTITDEPWILVSGGLLTACAIAWLLLCTRFLPKGFLCLQKVCVRRWTV